MTAKRENHRKNLLGTVISASPDKTVVVSVKWKTKHPIYGKYIGKKTKIMAHDEKNECKEGDRVSLVETRPISRRKHFRVESILSGKA